MAIYEKIKILYKMSNKTNRLNKKCLADNRKKGSATSYVVSTIVLNHLKEGSLIILLAVSLFFLISFFSYHPFDPGWSRTAQHLQIANMAGNAGAWCADLFLYFFGVLAYLFPVVILYGCCVILINKKFINTPLLWAIRIFGFSLTILSAAAIVSLFSHHKMVMINLLVPVSSGGVLGDLLSDYFFKHANFLGSLIILIPSWLAGITAMTGISWLGLLRIIYLIVKKILITVIKNIVGLCLFMRNFILIIISKIMQINKKRGAVIKTKVVNKSINTPNNLSNSFSHNLKSETLPIATDSSITVNSVSAQQEAARNFVKQIKNKPAMVNKNNNNKTTNLPTVNLLEKSDNDDVSSHPNSLPDAANVQAKLADFGIAVQITDIFPGPVITRIEMQLAPGSKASKITSLSKDLARSLSLPSVRVVEVIPGKSVVGLEIPNKKRALVRLREILSSEQYIMSNCPLTLALGKDISGIPVVADLSRMPHLLVAGTTGSGKSVGVNVMLLSILFKSTPEDVRLILIDPKMLELSIYDGIPHLLTPVVTDMKDAANALNWCVFEMERRYKLMANIGVRNLISFNHKVQTASNTRNPITHPFYNSAVPESANNKKYLEKLPYIVVIIDEFADMMMVVGKKVEEQISRIAQKARAAGIHMILATQRPSVDVITGLIKANIPTRIAYQVSSRIDSRTILDQQGAEQLLGHGDLLYLPPGSGMPVRVHGAFVTDEEVHKVVTYFKESFKDVDVGNFAINLSKMQDLADNNSILDNFGEADPLYDEAVAIVTSSRKASISYLQRRLKIGFNRAARLIEDMQNRNIVSTQNNGVREVLAPPPVTE
jgi:S-DNA-T family DNA segregation ATPase FtsK/SpoIIIE